MFSLQGTALPCGLETPASGDPGSGSLVSGDVACPALDLPVPPLASGHLLWPSPHPCTCVGLPGGTPLPSSLRGGHRGPLLGKLGEASFSLPREPWCPGHPPASLRGRGARWMTEASAGLRCEHIPVVLSLPCSGSCLPNKEWPRELGGASQKPRGKPQSTTPHHDLPHFWTATCQRSVWLTSASPHHLAWEKPPS